SGTVVTTGVRGLDEQKLKNATPNTRAVDGMVATSASKSEADKFAKDGKLSAKPVEHVGAKS
ncbi:MAG TPA: hypothetical protein VIT92_03040, partial [Burkholderiaceae bacterium]